MNCAELEITPLSVPRDYDSYIHIYEIKWIAIVNIVWCAARSACACAGCNVSKREGPCCKTALSLLYRVSSNTRVHLHAPPFPGIQMCRLQFKREHNVLANQLCKRTFATPRQRCTDVIAANTIAGFKIKPKDAAAVCGVGKSSTYTAASALLHGNVHKQHQTSGASGMSWHRVVSTSSTAAAAQMLRWKADWRSYNPRGDASSNRRSLQRRTRRRRRRRSSSRRRGSSRSGRRSSAGSKADKTIAAEEDPTDPIDRPSEMIVLCTVCALRAKIVLLQLVPFAFYCAPRCFVRRGHVTANGARPGCCSCRGGERCRWRRCCCRRRCGPGSSKPLERHGHPSIPTAGVGPGAGVERASAPRNPRRPIVIGWILQPIVHRILLEEVYQLQW